MLQYVKLGNFQYRWFVWLCFILKNLNLVLLYWGLLRQIWCRFGDEVIKFKYFWSSSLIEVYWMFPANGNPIYYVTVISYLVLISETVWYCGEKDCLHLLNMTARTYVTPPPPAPLSQKKEKFKPFCWVLLRQTCAFFWWCS